MAVKSQRIARTGVLGLLLVVSRALLVAPASVTASLVMEAAGAGATPTVSEIASRTKAWVPARHESDMEDSMATSSAQ
jgi:hypothetical protein